MLHPELVSPEGEAWWHAQTQILGKISALKKEYRDITYPTLEPRERFSNFDSHLFPEIQLLSLDALDGLVVRLRETSSPREQHHRLEQLRQTNEEMKGYVLSRSFLRIGDSVIIRSSTSSVICEDNFDENGFVLQTTDTTMVPIMPTFQANRFLYNIIPTKEHQMRIVDTLLFHIEEQEASTATVKSEEQETTSDEPAAEPSRSSRNTASLDTSWTFARRASIFMEAARLPVAAINVEAAKEDPPPKIQKMLDIVAYLRFQDRGRPDQEQRKIVVFCRWSGSLRILQYPLAIYGFGSVILDGSKDTKDRAAIIRAIQGDQPQPLDISPEFAKEVTQTQDKLGDEDMTCTRILLLSEAGFEGINLTLRG